MKAGLSFLYIFCGYLIKQLPQWTDVWFVYLVKSEETSPKSWFIGWFTKINLFEFEEYKSDDSPKLIRSSLDFMLHVWYVCVFTCRNLLLHVTLLKTTFQSTTGILLWIMSVLLSWNGLKNETPNIQRYFLKWRLFSWYVWENYSYLIRGHLRCWYSKGIIPKSPKHSGLGIIEICPDIIDVQS